MHFHTAVPSLRPLASSQTWELHQLGKFPLFSPSGFSKNPRTGLVRMPHHLWTTWMQLWGFIKLSAQNKVVHMVLSLCLSVHLSRNLRAYTVGTL
jgi:hypothetical protein